jgi:hypothetical protein
MTLHCIAFSLLLFTCMQAADAHAGGHRAVGGGQAGARQSCREQTVSGGEMVVGGQAHAGSPSLFDTPKRVEEMANKSQMSAAVKQLISGKVTAPRSALVSSSPPPSTDPVSKCFMLHISCLP